MDLEWFALIAFAALAIFIIFLGQYVGVVLAIVGVLGVAIVVGLKTGLSTLEYVPFSSVAVYSYVVFPLFILMGEVMAASGVVNGLYETAEKWLGRLKGGLGMAVAMQACFIGAVTGSIMAACAMMTRTAYPHMMKHGYDPGASTGLIAAAGPIAIIIPPSVMLVFYGMLVEQSIGKLLVAGIVPGFMAGLIYMGMIYTMATISPQKWPRSESRYSWGERVSSIRYILPFIGTLGLVLGGLYAGIFTPTEAGAVGSFIALVILIAIKKKKTPRLFYNSVRESAGMTSMIFFILIGGMIYARFLAVTGVSGAVVDFIAGATVNKYLILAMVTVFFIFLGCFIDSFPMLVITMPVVYPLMMKVGFDPIWFGVVAVIYVGMSVITPPMGLAVFTLYTLTEGKIELMKIFSGAFPFLVAMMLLIVVITIFPQIVLWLPSKMY